MSEQINKLVKKNLADFRTKLLDLTGRNPLLNFKINSERGKGHIRLVDELPDFIYGELRDEKTLSFKSLPPLDNEPHDEKSEGFQSEFRRAKLTDEQYLKEMDAIADSEEALDLTAKIDRNLKNRLRAQLGMPTIHDLKPLSNSEWAKKNNINPQYDLPKPAKGGDIMAPAAQHADSWMQTLLSPKELQQKLQGLKRLIKSDSDETGVNTFYAAFGFLQWYDSEAADKPMFAPLILLQLDQMTENRTRNGNIHFSLQSPGEEPQSNLPLAERLKQFGLALPEMDENDTPESYMQKVETMIVNYPRWKVRRFVAIGRFQFARLVMYHDLDPAKWPGEEAIDQHSIIRELLTGQSSSESSGQHEVGVYDIDRDPEVEQLAPILITDADSSQHSAIMDVMRGRNLVIKGPPGTGKSQTITNLIANAMTKGKKVLFVAEKMAALNVVHDRLKKAGLGDYCLELHSTKSKFKSVKADLETSLENRSRPVNNPNFSGKLSELNTIRGQLRDYSELLHQPIEGLEKTIYEVLWSEQAKRQVMADQPHNVKRIRIKDPQKIDALALNRFCEELKNFAAESTSNDIYGRGNHPWHGVLLANLSGLKLEEILAKTRDCLEQLDITQEVARHFMDKHQRQLGARFVDWEQFIQALDSILELEKFQSQINVELLTRLDTPEKSAAVAALIQQAAQYQSLVEEASCIVRTPESYLGKLENLSRLENEAAKLDLADKTSAEIEALTTDTRRRMGVVTQSEKHIVYAAEKILGKPNPSITDLVLISDALIQLKSINREALLRRNPESLNEANKPLIESACKKLQSIKALEKHLSASLDVGTSISLETLDQAIVEFSNAHLLSYLKPGFYRAKKTYALISKTSEKLSHSEKSEQLRALKKLKEERSDFLADNRYQHIAGNFYEGTNTSFELLKVLNTWSTNVNRRFAQPGAEYRQALDFLTTGSLTDIDTVLNYTRPVDLDVFLGSIGKLIDKDKSLAELMERYEKHLNSCALIQRNLDALKANDGIRFDDIRNIHENVLEKLPPLLAKINENQTTCSSLIGESYRGANSPVKTLNLTLSLSRLIDGLGDASHQAANLRSEAVFKICRHMSDDINDLRAKLKTTCAELDGFVDAGEIQLPSYFGQSSIVATPVVQITQRLQKSLEHEQALATQVRCNAFIKRAADKPYHGLIKAQADNQQSHDLAPLLFEYLYYKSLCDQFMAKYPDLDGQQLASRDELKEKFKKLDLEIIKMQAKEVVKILKSNRPPAGNNHGRVSDYTDMGLINHQVNGNARGIPLRRLIDRAGNALQVLKPCFLMSPLSVAQYISPHGIKFDLLVIDEASQMRPEDSLGAVARCGQIVVVGDPQQLPPTAFFQKQSQDSADDYEDEDRIQNESILDMAHSRYFPPRDLRWHYRSRHESLIAFSNKEFYDQKLIIFPSPVNSNHTFGVRSVFVGGLYKASCNVDEAKAVVEAARRHMREFPDRSIGIATMNSQQRDLIEEEMDRVAQEDSVVQAYRAQWDSDLEPFFIKNLESVQGDERDTILISTVYGPSAPNTKPMQRFGPINGAFGHRRLNVLFTRAKHNLVVYTSLRPDQITVTETSSLGLRAFKAYLEYAATGRLEGGINTNRLPDSDFEIWVKTRLESRGYEVVPQVGVAGYYIDLAVKHPDYPYGYLLGIECDGAMYHSSKSARDRDRIRQQVLEGLGWSIYRIWSTSWFHDTDNEFNKLIAHIERLLSKKLAEHTELEKKHQEVAKSFQSTIQPTLFDTAVLTQKDIQAPIAETVTNKQDIVEVFDTVTYTVLNSDKQESTVVTLISGMSDVASGHINQHTAIGRALLGASLNDEVDIELPTGVKVAKITSIKKHSAR